MPYKEERPLFRRMVISLSHEILTYLRFEHDEALTLGRAVALF
jgi:hypothetical protein